jgi:23S rRNA pseudouridine2604 synthase
MARSTLKLPRHAGPVPPSKAPSGRALRAHRGKPPAAKVPAAPPTPAAAAAAPAAPAATPGPKRPPRSKTPDDRGARRRPTTPAAAEGRPPVRPGAARPKAKHGTEPARRARPVATAPTRSPPRPAIDAARPPTDLTGNPRLSKLMSERGLCSRREADEWIENGWVKVDGVVAAILGTRVSPDARIDVDPAARRHQSERVTILLNKPVGYVSGQAEEGYQPAIVLIRPENRWAEDRLPRKFVAGHLRGLAPAGRLDIDSTGLLVLTQDGRVAKRLIGEDSAVEKEYLVRVEGELSPAGMKLLNHGLELDGRKLKPARVSWQNEHQLRFVLREGMKRQIRRMCEQVGLTVTGLKRVRSGGVALGKLPVGKWRYLRPDEEF